MEHPLYDHIIYLENSIRDVKNRLAQPSLTPEETEDLQLQLSLGESALEYYRKAYSLERTFAGSDPPNHSSGSESNLGKANADKLKSNRDGSHLGDTASVRKAGNPHRTRFPLLPRFATKRTSKGWRRSEGL